MPSLSMRIQHLTLLLLVLWAEAGITLLLD
jgi:hypothetical protein